MMRRLLPAALLALAALPAWAQENPSFNVVNRTGAPIKAVFASPAGVANWGRNRLAAAAVAPGANAPIRLPADGNCIYDVRVVGGLNWSSQHPCGGGCDEHTEAAFGSVWAGGDTLSRPATGGAA